MAKPGARAPQSLEAANEEARSLWSRYRHAQDHGATREAVDALRSGVRAARAAAKRRIEEEGFRTLYQQLTDLSEYAKRLTPVGSAPPADPATLLAEVDALRVALRAGDERARGGLEGRALAIFAKIEAARAQDPTDPDHDAYVDVEESLWDLGFASPD